MSPPVKPWRKWFRSGAAWLALATVLGAGAAAAEPVKLGMVTFLSGPATGHYGIPTANAARLLIDAINDGAIPPPYERAGFAGRAVEVVIVDEAGGATKQVSEFRNLVQRQGVDAVVGYVSSGSCLAIAPVAEEMRALTVLFTCGTPRIFEENSYRYVFRTIAHATMDGVAAARYLLDRDPGLGSFAGINPNYAWGHDSWRDFSLTLTALKGDAALKAHLLPKLFAGNYNAEISALLVSGADVVHSSLWGGDLESFVVEAAARGLAARTMLVLTTGEAMVHALPKRIPAGVAIGGRGPYGLFDEDTPLNAWFRDTYEDRFGAPPTFPAYQLAQAILGLKVAYDRAGPGADTEAVIDAFEYMEYEAFGATVRMALGQGHQAITDTAYGLYAYDPERGPTVTDVIRYPASCVNPPEGMTSVAWIEAGMPGADCP